MSEFKENSFDVVGLGVSPLDILALVDHFPTGDEVQQAIEVTAQGGGPVATALVTLARLGSRTAMLDAVGDDWRGRLILDEFRRENVSTGYIQVRSGFSSATASILVRQGTGERAIYHFPGSAPELSPEELPSEVIQSSRFLHVNGRHWEACKKAVSDARKAGVKVSFDGGAGRYRPELKQLIPEVDICIVAKQFVLAYTNKQSLAESAHDILEEGPRLVVITAGTQGSWIFEKGGTSFHQPAFLLPGVIDTTGCGDSYHGAFLFGMLHGFPLYQTACFASAVAALNSLGLGGRAALPDYKSVINFIERQMPGKYHLPDLDPMK